MYSRLVICNPSRLQPATQEESVPPLRGSGEIQHPGPRPEGRGFHLSCPRHSSCANSVRCIESYTVALMTSQAALLKRLWLQRDVLFAGGLLLPVLADPGFPAFASGGVASSEGQGGDIGIRNRNFLRRILRNEAHDGGVERWAVAPVEDVTFHARTIFARDGHVAAVVEGPLQRIAQFGFAGQLGDPAFDLVVVAAGGDFQRIDGQVTLRFAHFGTSEEIGVLRLASANPAEARSG